MALGGHAPGSLGKWLQGNVTKTAIASYLGPILINEGYAEEEWQKWDGRLLTETSYSQVMEEMKFGKRAEEQIGEKLDQESTDYDDRGFPIITLWAFFNVLTWFITFKTTSLNHRVEMERRLRAAVVHFKA